MKMENKLFWPNFLPDNFFLQDNYLSNIIGLKFKLRYDIYM